MKKEAYDYDVVVVGGGSAGIAAAERAAEAGASVCLVEEGYLGGECSYEACTPTKALLYAARMYDDIRRNSSYFGISVKKPRFHYAQMVKRKDALLGALYQQGRNVARFLEERGVIIAKGKGRFSDSHTLLVGPAKKITGKAFVIATGSKDADVSFRVDERVTLLRYRDVLRMTHVPRSVVMIGGGPVGCELATLWSLLGVRVTLLQHASQLLPHEDGELAMLVEKGLRERGVHVVCNARVLEVQKKSTKPCVVYQQEDGQRVSAQAEEVCVATGRIPHVAHLAIEHISSGKKHIFYAGDVAGGVQFTAVAAAQGSIAGWNAAHVGKTSMYERFDDRVIPRVTFVAPELASVGLVFSEAKKQDRNAFIHRVPLRILSRASIDFRRDGMLKVVLAGDGETVLGAHFLGERAGEVIHEYALAMRAGIPWSVMRGMVRAYPTYSEIVGL